MNSHLQLNISSLLDEIASQLDLSPSKYKQAVDRYTAVCSWIEEGQTDGVGELHFYPQGSFRFGTVIRPIRGGKDSEYDIDLVCEAQIPKSDTTPQAIKQAIGQRLKENEKYRKMLDEEGRRCWTLLYAEDDGVGFHLDVLPAVPEEFLATNLPVHPNYQQTAIAITHKNEDRTYKWCSSNPNGYAQWFSEKNKTAFEQVKSVQQRSIFEKNQDIYARIEDVPDALIKTPLQRAIQILKRHRDVRFINHKFSFDKPISMIITTLAAQLYNGEGNVYAALSNIVDQLDALGGLLQPGYKQNAAILEQDLIRRNDDGTWSILNPVNPEENFADRWHENDHRKAKTFFQWTQWVKKDLIQITETNDIGKVVKSFESTLGQISNTAAKSLGFATTPASIVVPTVQLNNPTRPWGSL
ncbi:nucleotidyltransferase [Paenibacillus sp. GCM10012306]|uniref:nucleotidyltransferase domain-containing protein n=1 Tax=Paenibacillus sp. GCM10012306 TaxID=3317342 RepID=UPI00361C0C50